MVFFDNPKQRYKKLLIVILPVFIALIIMLFLSYNSVLKSLGSNSAISGEKKYEIESMNYQLRSNATDYQIEIFKELEEAVKDENEQKIVEGVAKNFIADVYTWTNKEDMWDVGGMSFVYSRYRTTTYYELRDTIYQLMARAKRDFNEEDQVEVTNVEIVSCNKSSEMLEIENKKFEAYDVECYITFSGHKNLTNLITHNQYLTIIKDTDENGRYEIAVSYGG